MARFYKVHVKNDWEHISYTLDGKDFFPIAGTKVKVKYPDKTTDIVPIEYQINFAQVDDHGHSYTVEQSIMGFYKTMLGIRFWVPIEEVLVNENVN